MQGKYTRLLVLAMALLTGAGLAAQAPQGADRSSAAAPGGDQAAIIERATRRAVLNQARQAAAARTQAALVAKGGKVDPKTLGVNPAAKAAPAAPLASGTVEKPTAVPGPGFQLAQPDYMFGTASNWHNTKPIRKFVNGLAGLGAAQANNLGNYIPFAVPDRTTFSGSDYYQIDLIEYKQQLHSDLLPTRLRGYQDHTAAAPLNTKGTLDSTGATLHANYLGPVIIAKKDRAVRIKLTNLLPFGPVVGATGRRPGDLFLPVDTTLMGAGTGSNLGLETYTQNRAELHLHGGLNPWISDGTPHQWITPAGETTSYKKGVSFANVPDMVTNPAVFPTAPSAGDGIATYYYSNQQSGRLMFYHDHAYGLTRLNVYAGEAAGYVIVDPVETRLINQGIIPSPGSILPISDDPWDTAAYNASTHPVHPPLFDASTGQVQNVYAYGIPLVIQDKTFVDTASLGTIGQMGGTDPTWSVSAYGGDGSLWFPHVYMTNQNPADISGANAMGRWDYGPWFWPPLTAAAGLLHGSEPVVGDPNGTEIPGTPNPSLTPESFMDTPVVNGVPYPTLTVQPTAYRFRILSAGNDRMWNLNFFKADTTGTEVTMVTAAPNPAWPATWPTDGRDGGVPDPATAGPSFIQIGNESGFLPNPVVIPAQPIGYNYNRRDIVVLNVSDHGLFLGPAERADVIVDFSAFAGQTLILYNDAPAPVPAFDSRLDYYTGDPDQRTSGGANTTQPGMGPNTRTIMQVIVANTTPSAPFDLAKLVQAFESTSTYKGAFAEAQHLPIVPQLAYNRALNKSLYTGTATNATFANDVYSRIQDYQTRYQFPAMENGNLIQPYFDSKAIQELFELNYGRMNATLGIELPRTNFNIQTTIPLGYIDSPTEVLTDGTTGYWKITHNGVDTHPVHFHLVDVQIMNRVGWDGAVRMPEANELGWKETVRMNPLEDIIVAFRPLSPRLPFFVPNSSREQDPTQPYNTMVTFTDPATGNPITGLNTQQNYGWEYVWHCHILGHEENDFMRPVVLNVATSKPNAPTGLQAATTSGHIDLTWTDRASNETGFTIQRATTAGGPWTEIATTVPNQARFSDMTVVPGVTYYYQVAAYNQAGTSAFTTASTSASSQIVVSGVVDTLSGATSLPLPGVSVAFSTGGTVTTSTNGSYSKTVSSGWAGTITPTLAGYAFLPVSRTLTAQTANAPNQNFVAHPVVTISGTVSVGGTGLAGVVVTLSNGGGTATTNASGVYTATVAAGWSGRATPAKLDVSFAPAYIDYSNVVTSQTGQNYVATLVIVISGTLTTTGGSPASNVVVYYSPTTYVTSDASGNYSVTVPSPFTGTITPIQAGVVFTPISKSFTAATTDQTAQNFVASGATLMTGTVVNSSGVGLAGVTLTASTGQTATTRANGTYSLYLPTPFTGSVTPSLAGYSFTPATLSFTGLAADVSGKNFTASVAISVSGRVTLNALGLAGATVTFSTGQVATTDVNGNYSIVLPSPYTGTVSAAMAGYFITPLSTSILNSAANVTGVNFTAVPAIPITGQIYAFGLPLPNVVVTLSNGVAPVLTNASGNYTVSVPSGWTGTITPSLTGYTFTPTSLNLTNVVAAPAAQNFTANGIINISGTILNGTSPLSNVRLTFAPATGVSGGILTAYTSATGAYSIALQAGWAGTITPVLRGYTFSPASITLAATSTNLTGQNFGTVRTITGQAVDINGVALSGVTISFTGGTPVTTSATGSFTLIVPTGWTGTITAALTGITTWTPASFTYSNVTANITGLRFTGQ